VLGSISGKLGDWRWFGHSGGFLGYISRTAVIPDHDLSISCLTNAVDGLSHFWLDGALAILKRFNEGGAPRAELADWSGRWWSVWRPTDLLPVGDKVLLSLPGQLNPVAKVAELTVTGQDEARISQAGAFGNYGETARLIRDAAGAVSAVRLAGEDLLGETALTAELDARYGR